MTPENFNPHIAHLNDSQGRVFQVLNEEGTDWDEQATYEAFKAANPQ